MLGIGARSCNEGRWDRLEILNDTTGVWKCRTTFNRTKACPRGIEVTKAISEVKRALTTGTIQAAASAFACDRA